MRLIRVSCFYALILGLWSVGPAAGAKGQQPAGQPDQALRQRQRAYADLERTWRQILREAEPRREAPPNPYRPGGSEWGEGTDSTEREGASRKDAANRLQRLAPGYKKLAENQGTDADSRRLAAAAQRRLGNIQSRLGHPAEALAEYQQCVRTLQEVAGHRAATARDLYAEAAVLFDIGAESRRDARAKATRRSNFVAVREAEFRALAAFRETLEVLTKAALLPAAGADKAAAGDAREAMEAYAEAQGTVLEQILSGQALNELLQDIDNAKPHRPDRQSAPLNGRLLANANLVVAALPPKNDLGYYEVLRAPDKLAWPPALNTPATEEARKTIATVLARSVRGVQAGTPVDADGRKALNEAVESLQAHLKDVIADLSPAEYVESKRYLTRLSRAADALGKPGVLNRQKLPDFDNVADLVAHLTESDLRFLTAKKGDEGAYLALHLALWLGRDAIPPPAGR